MKWLRPYPEKVRVKAVHWRVPGWIRVNHDLLQNFTRINPHGFM